MEMTSGVLKIFTPPVPSPPPSIFHGKLMSSDEVHLHHTLSCLSARGQYHSG